MDSFEKSLKILIKQLDVKAEKIQHSLNNIRENIQTIQKNIDHHKDHMDAEKKFLYEQGNSVAFMTESSFFYDLEQIITALHAELFTQEKEYDLIKKSLHQVFKKIKTYEILLKTHQEKSIKERLKKEAASLDDVGLQLFIKNAKKH